MTTFGKLLIAGSIGIIALMAFVFIQQISAPEKTSTQEQEKVSTSTPVSSGTVVTANPNLRNVNIKAGDTIGSPLVITGEAKTWYFEASFPVQVLDATGKVIASGPAQAQGEWMTSEFVPFKATLTFTKPTTPTGTLRLQNDNPSGLPENSQVVDIPVKFNLSEKVTVVKLFYPKTSSTIKDECSVDRVQEVSREIPITKTPIGDTLKLLIKGELSSAEQGEGYTTEFPHKGFDLKGTNLKNGVLTLEFTEVPGFTTGGSCRVGLLRAQIEKTALQFADVKSVKIIPEGIFQP